MKIKVFPTAREVIRSLMEVSEMRELASFLRNPINADIINTNKRAFDEFQKAVRRCIDKLLKGGE